MAAQLCSLQPTGFYVSGTSTKTFLQTVKKHFSDVEWKQFIDDWNTLLKQNSAEEFEAHWNELSERINPEVKRYLETVWLPFKESFANAWNFGIPHYGNLATSRAEGSHAALKRYIMNTTGDLLSTTQSILEAVKTKYDEFQILCASERIHIPSKCMIGVFEKVVKRVSKRAPLQLAYPNCLKQEPFKLIQTFQFAVKNSLPRLEFHVLILYCQSLIRELFLS